MVTSVTVETSVRLYTKTMRALLEMKIDSVAFDGVQVIWQHLSAAQLDRLNQVKQAFLIGP